MVGTGSPDRHCWVQEDIGTEVVGGTSVEGGRYVVGKLVVWRPMVMEPGSPDSHCWVQEDIGTEVWLQKVAHSVGGTSVEGGR